MFRITLLSFLFFPFVAFAHFTHHGHEEIRNEIVRAIDPWSIGNKNKKAAKPFAHQIINGLYLGNHEKFAETLEVPCRNSKKKKLDTSNPHQFEVIISLCTYPRMVKEMSDLKKFPLPRVENNFKERGITWIQLGRSLPDDKDAWTDLVFNATFPNSPEARKDLNIPRNSKKARHVKFRKAKRRVVEKIPVEKWFEPTFKIMDEAVFSGKKMLIHCQAGASRSPCLVAAYLINRYGVSAKQAVSFLRTKRNCSNPKCMKDLKKYAKLLQKSHALKNASIK